MNHKKCYTSSQERDAMEGEKEVVDGLRRNRTVKQDFVTELKNLKRAMEEFRTSVNTAKTVGTSVGAVGTVAAVIGVMMAFFTAGASLALTATAIGAGVAGGVTNLTASIVEHNKYKEYMERIEKLVKKCAEEERNLSQIIESYVCQAAKNAGLDVNSYLHWAKEIGLTGLRELSSATGTINGVQAARQAATVSKLLKYGTLTGSITKTSTGIGFQAASPQGLTALMANEANAMGTVVKYGPALNTTAKVTGKVVLSATLGVIQVGATAWEIADLVKSWNNQHPAVEAVDGIISILQADIGELDQLKKSIAK